jgi:tripartite-type tricarboxylate transporter receptor subunit TctC
MISLKRAPGCLISAGIAIGCAMLAEPAFAQAWPAKTARVIVPFSPGSATDLLPRTVFENVSARAGHPIIIDNCRAAVARSA